MLTIVEMTDIKKQTHKLVKNVTLLVDVVMQLLLPIVPVVMKEISLKMMDHAEIAM